MSYLRGSTFTESVKGKVIIAFCVALIALILAWGVSKVAFREMLSTVQNISAPDLKLRIVNNLFKDITKLDQVQRSQAFHPKPVSYKTFLKESDALRATMDSLRSLYSDEPAQIARIDKMKGLLKERDSLFISYLKEREGLINSKDFTSQLNSLSGLINKSSAAIDSTIVTTEQKFSTTTVMSEGTRKKNKEKGFLGKLFGKKKNDPEPQHVVKEEVSITVDTLAKANSDSMIHAMEKAVKRIRTRQHQRSTRFINREIELANAGNILINQMLVVLQQVEKEAIAQADRNNEKAREVVNTSVRSIEWIMLCFVLITAFFVYLILTDISRSNAYREELEAAKEEAEYHGLAKQRFLSSMSHEIRTPLQSIIGYAEQIKDQEKPDRKNIEAIYHSSVHLLHIVNEVLDYSRIVSGKFRFTRSTFSMAQLLDEVIMVMRPQAAKKSLSLLLENKVKDLDFVVGDPFRLKQILFNLLANAIKFTSEGSVTLTVSNQVAKRKSYFTFLVRDTGPGIDKKDLDAIFNEFEQAEANVTANTNGTGLGLSIVKALTEGQGGVVEVESEPGKGSCFIVKLKYVIAREPASSLPKKESLRPVLHQKVWIVDDDEFILELCGSVLEKHHIRHRCFNRPEEVLKADPDEDLNVILMDMRMPGMSGRELCRLLKERLDGSVKIYALTAQALPEERQLILSEGFDGLLMKPFRESELLKLLKIESVPVKVEKPARATTPDLDFTALEKMAFGDKELIRKIMGKFEKDTMADVTLLKEAMARGTVSEVSLLLHRIAGRTAQIGVRELSSRFRAEELELGKTTLLGEDQKQRISLLTEDLLQLRVALATN